MDHYKTGGLKSVVFNVLEISPVSASLRRHGRDVDLLTFRREGAQSATSRFFAGVGGLSQAVCGFLKMPVEKSDGWEATPEQTRGVSEKAREAHRVQAQP